MIIIIMVINIIVDVVFRTLISQVLLMELVFIS